MGASNSASCSRHLENKSCGSKDGLTESSGRMEAQLSASNSPPLEDSYISIRASDIRADYLYTGLLQHYRLGNTITVTFNLVPEGPQLNNYASNDRAIIRLAPSNSSRGDTRIEYEFHIESSTILAFALIFGKKSNRKCHESFILATRAKESTDSTGVTSHAEGKLPGSSISASKACANDTSSLKQPIGPLEKIVQCSSKGGRIMCITVMGRLDADTTVVDLSSPKSRFTLVRHVDIFYEAPLTPIPAMFIYQAVTAIIPYKVTSRIGSKTVSVVFDYMDVFMRHLIQGWKLVGIIQYHAGKNMLKSIWFFEKEANRVDDPTPVYEGTIVTHEHIFEGTTKGDGGDIKSDVTPILNEMGSKGWEIACLLETPDAKRLNTHKIQIKMLLFFQRPIISQV